MKVFITGGTSGIGLALAREYHQAGWDVGVCGRNLEKLSEEDKNKFKTYKVDVRSKDEVSSAVNEFADGSLDLMIANAGIAIELKTSRPDFDLARKVMDININGVINAFEAAYDIMSVQKRGHLVATASVAGFTGLPGAAAYSGSKAAVIKFCESLALDLAHEGITVTAVCPGFIDTPLTKKNKYKMPFLMDANTFAVKTKSALDQKKKLFVIPWQMHLLMSFLERVPRSMYRWLMSRVDYRRS